VFNIAQLLNPKQIRSSSAFRYSAAKKQNVSSAGRERIFPHRNLEKPQQLHLTVPAHGGLRLPAAVDGACRAALQWRGVSISPDCRPERRLWIATLSAAL
jgi:hypothetical protein